MKKGSTEIKIGKKTQTKKLTYTVKVLLKDLRKKVNVPQGTLESIPTFIRGEWDTGDENDSNDTVAVTGYIKNNP